MNLVLIYPEDPSITFLDPIFNGLCEWTENKMQILKPSNDEESIAKTIYEIEQIQSDSTIIFMGHGASNLLHANVHEEEVLMDLNVARRVFREKNLIAISCRSSEFIKNIGLLKSGIGFGHIPTEIEDIEIEIEAGEYEIEPHRATEITARFNHEFVSIMFNSLGEFILNNESFSYLRKRIILRTNKALDNLNLKNEHDRLIGNFLFEMKNRIEVIS